MTFQNRVTPLGEITATPERGLFTGNRGVIHDPATGLLLKRRWAGKAWIVCDCGFKGRRRTVMGPGWTNLFFLDVATALAAGHRPCFECRRAEAEAFRAAWWASRPGATRPSAPEMDAQLHAERLDGKIKRLHPLQGPLTDLPTGAMVAEGASAFVVIDGHPLLWSHAGYSPAPPPREPKLLTPPSTLAALRAGFRPVLHPSAEAALSAG